MMQNLSDVCVIYTRDNQCVQFTIRQLFDKAIIPVLKDIVSNIMSCLIDKAIFGEYEIAKLFVTGSCLPLKDYNTTYHHLVVSELLREFKYIIRLKSYKTKLEMVVQTCKQHQTALTISANNNHQAFCYHIFKKGELRIVSNATYNITTYPLRPQRISDLPAYVSNIIFARNLEMQGISRGDEFAEQRIKISGFPKNACICKYCVQYLNRQ